MGLISDLQRDMLDPKTSLSTILRKAKVLASTLRNEELKKWVENELSGYGDNKEEVPDYRRGQPENLGDFVGGFGARMKNAPIPTLNLPNQIKEFASELYIVEGVRTLESHLESDSHNFFIPWPADLVALLSNQFYKGYVCLRAWKSFSRGKVEQVLDSVRNRLLNFILELQERYPEVAKSEEAISDIPREQVTPMVNTYIFGSHNVVASGINIEQTVHQMQTNDLDGLLKYMEKIGVGSSDVKELEKAIKEDGSRTEPGKFGSKVTDWVGKMTKKILEGVWNVSIQAGPTLLAEALFRYYGWK
jgi:hypothetical protein